MVLGKFYGLDFKFHGLNEKLFFEKRKRLKKNGNASKKEETPQQNKV